MPEFKNYYKIKLKINKIYSATQKQTGKKKYRHKNKIVGHSHNNELVGIRASIIGEIKLSWYKWGQ